mmetsp:Transcript_1784/g.5632  ORF Transcript_1784/g.5632 Transcript_1784/m.5632 type:complete len:337 (+) Transcript_1784:183-1193(+)
MMMRRGHASAPTAGWRGGTRCSEHAVPAGHEHQEHPLAVAAAAAAEAAKAAAAATAKGAGVAGRVGVVADHRAAVLEVVLLGDGARGREREGAQLVAVHLAKNLPNGRLELAQPLARGERHRRHAAHLLAARVAAAAGHVDRARAGRVLGSGRGGEERRRRRRRARRGGRRGRRLDVLLVVVLVVLVVLVLVVVVVDGLGLALALAGRGRGVGLALVLLGGRLALKLGDEVGVQVLPRLPRVVVRVVVPLPLDVVLGRLARGTRLEDRFHLVLLLVIVVVAAIRVLGLGGGARLVDPRVGRRALLAGRRPGGRRRRGRGATEAERRLLERRRAAAR